MADMSWGGLNANEFIMGFISSALQRSHSRWRDFVLNYFPELWQNTFWLKICIMNSNHSVIPLYNWPFTTSGPKFQKAISRRSYDFCEQELDAWYVSPRGRCWRSSSQSSDLQSVKIKCQVLDFSRDYFRIPSVVIFIEDQIWVILYDLKLCGCTWSLSYFYESHHVIKTISMFRNFLLN